MMAAWGFSFRDASSAVEKESPRDEATVDAGCPRLHPRHGALMWMIDARQNAEATIWTQSDEEMNRLSRAGDQMKPPRGNTYPARAA